MPRLPRRRLAAAFLLCALVLVVCNVFFHPDVHPPPSESAQSFPSTTASTFSDEKIARVDRDRDPSCSPPPPEGSTSSIKSVWFWVGSCSSLSSLVSGIAFAVFCYNDMPEDQQELPIQQEVPRAAAPAPPGGGGPVPAAIATATANASASGPPDPATASAASDPPGAGVGSVGGGVAAVDIATNVASSGSASTSTSSPPAPPPPPPPSATTSAATTSAVASATTTSATTRPPSAAARMSSVPRSLLGPVYPVVAALLSQLDYRAAALMGSEAVRGPEAAAARPRPSVIPPLAAIFFLTPVGMTMSVKWLFIDHVSATFSAITAAASCSCYVMSSQMMFPKINRRRWQLAWNIVYSAMITIIPATLAVVFRNREVSECVTALLFLIGSTFPTLIRVIFCKPYPSRSKPFKAYAGFSLLASLLWLLYSIFGETHSARIHLLGAVGGIICQSFALLCCLKVIPFYI